MKESSKVFAGLGLGLIAGGAAGYYLSSEGGRKFQRKTKAQLLQFSTNVKTKVEEKAHAASEKINSVAGYAKDWVSEVSDAVKHKIHNATNTTEDAVEEITEGFHSGVEKARKTIKDKTDNHNSMADKT